MKKCDIDGFDLPRNFPDWNPAMRGAYMKGARAFIAGESLGACPYGDHRKPSGGLSWSRAFIRSWEDGWEDAKRTAGALLPAGEAKSGETPADQRPADGAKGNGNG